MITNLKLIVSLAKINNRSNNLNNFVASVVELYPDINIDNLVNTSKFLNKHTNFFIKSNFIIIEFVLFGESKCIFNSNVIKYYNYNIFDLYDEILYNLHFDLSSQSVFSSLFKFNKYDDVIYSKINSPNNLFIKDNMSYNNIIFIFNGISWSNLLLLFRSIGINIYGGSNTKRHLLSTVQSNLVKFLLLINNMYLDPDEIYKSFVKIKNTGAYLDKEALRLEQNILNNKISIDSSTYNDEYAYLFMLEVNILSKIISRLSSLLKLIRELKSKELDLEQKISNNIFSKNTKAAIYSKYPNEYSKKKLHNSIKRLEISKNELKQTTSQKEEIYKQVRENILNLYKIKRDMYFTDDGIFKYDFDIKIVLSEKSSTLNTDNVIIEDSKFNS